MSKGLPLWLIQLRYANFNNINNKNNYNEKNNNYYEENNHDKENHNNEENDYKTNNQIALCQWNSCFDA